MNKGNNLAENYEYLTSDTEEAEEAEESSEECEELDSGTVDYMVIRNEARGPDSTSNKDPQPSSTEIFSEEFKKKARALDKLIPNSKKLEQNIADNEKIIRDLKKKIAELKKGQEDQLYGNSFGCAIASGPDQVVSNVFMGESFLRFMNTKKSVAPKTKTEGEEYSHEKLRNS